MTALAKFEAAARGRTDLAQRFDILPDSKSPGVALSATFAYQSYFDSTLLQNAILTQPLNQLIVTSTQRTENIAGYSFGLHPSSQTPVSVQPILGGQAQSAKPIILHPGQLYRPHGRPGDKAGNFSGFNWGLPYGWLGGGVATLYVFSSPDADAAWPGHSEVIFQRQRMLIAAPAAVPAAFPTNWPQRFPWLLAKSGTNATPQGGAPSISIAEPTRVLMSLESNTLATAATMRAYFQGTNDFDLNSAGTAVTTPVRFKDLVWGSYSPPAGLANVTAAYPVVELTGEWARLAADAGGVQLVDTGTSLAGLYVDVVRYGRL